MKVMLVHNFYGSSSPSGENQVFEAEKKLLKSRGHEVFEFTRHSDEIRALGTWGDVRGALATPWNPWMYQAVKDAVSRFKPDVVHVHNTFPLLSPSLFKAIGHTSARVLTLHNYRLFCPAAIPMREGKVCTQCLDACSALPAMRHGCYRNSRIATVPLALNVALHRFLGTWTTQVDAFITLSVFQRELMIKAGLPSDKVFVKPNFHPGNPPTIPWAERSPCVVFAGRLTAEKGVVNLLRAWQAWGQGAPELRLVGDGELRPTLERMAAGLPVQFLGQLPAEKARAEIANALLVVLPSECFETFGLVVVEAFAFGTPAAVSNLGPLPSIVRHGESGVVFEAANPESLLKTLRAVWQAPSVLERFGQGARQAFELHYNEDANYQQLTHIYQAAVEQNQRIRSQQT